MMSSDDGQRSASDDPSEHNPDVLSDVLTRQPKPDLAPPPTPSSTVLPFGPPLDPLLFERLVAEVAQSVFHLDDVHAYGRQGQYQAGLDIVGWKGDKQIVYQVRRIDVLDAPALQRAVEDFAAPTRRVKGKTTKVARPFPGATEFVLVTACVNDDTAVTDKLNELKLKYCDDFNVRLMDARSLSSTLRNYGAIVAGYFGLHWAQEFCTYSAPNRAGIGDGPGLLDDPLTAINKRETFNHAKTIERSNPGSAAAIYAEIATELANRSLPFAGALANEATRAYEAAGELDTAFHRSISTTINEIESCRWASEPLRDASRLASALGADENRRLVDLLRTCNAWYEHGFDLDPVLDSLRLLSVQKVSHITRVALLIAEQVVADEDDRDDHAALLDVLRGLPSQLIGVEAVRLRCAIADLEVIVGASPRDAYADLRDESFSDDGVRALVERRFGRACVYVDDIGAAVHAYRRAVMAAWHAGLGGDVRDALRSIAGITRTNPFPAQNPVASRAMESARSVINRQHLIGNKDPVKINALENIADRDLPDAVRWSHHWLRLERVSGGDYDEGYARRNYAHALQLASRTDSAVRQYLNLGSRKNTTSTAAALHTFLDASAQLGSRSQSRRACAADVLAVTADLIPDSDVPRIAVSLTDVFLASCDPTVPVDPDDAIATLQALAALDFRLPESSAKLVLARAVALTPREPDRYRFIDDDLIDFLVVTVRHHAELRAEATAALMSLVRQDVGHVADRISARLSDIEDVRTALVELASSESNRTAASILAEWNVNTATLASHARERIDDLMAQPINVPKTSFVVGSACTDASTALAASLDTTAATAEDLSELLQPWLSHLLARLCDSHMSADERMDAVVAVRPLVHHLSSTNRVTVVAALLDQFDRPQINAYDLMERTNSRDPLARYKFGGGGVGFESELLHTAAIAADTDEQVQQITSRLRSELRAPTVDQRIVMTRAQTAIQLNATSLVYELAASPEPSLRRAAAVLWAKSPGLDPALGEFLARDTYRGVRIALAQALTAGGAKSASSQALAILRVDTSAIVRKKADAIASSSVDDNGHDRRSAGEANSTVD